MVDGMMGFFRETAGEGMTAEKMKEYIDKELLPKMISNAMSSPTNKFEKLLLDEDDDSDFSSIADDDGDSHSSEEILSFDNNVMSATSKDDNSEYN